MCHFAAPAQHVVGGGRSLADAHAAAAQQRKLLAQPASKLASRAAGPQGCSGLKLKSGLARFIFQCTGSMHSTAVLLTSKPSPLASYITSEGHSASCDLGLHPVAGTEARSLAAPATVTSTHPSSMPLIEAISCDAQVLSLSKLQWDASELSPSSSPADVLRTSASHSVLSVSGFVASAAMQQ